MAIHPTGAIWNTEPQPMRIVTKKSGAVTFASLAKRLNGGRELAFGGIGSETPFHQWFCIYYLLSSKSRRLWALEIENYGDPENLMVGRRALASYDGSIFLYMIDNVEPVSAVVAAAQLRTGEKVNEEKILDRLVARYLKEGGMDVDGSFP